jgi:tetratricopeptide (TPR) repeat protein
MGDPYLTLLIGIYFSRTAQAVGQLTEAQNVLYEGLRFAQETGNRWGVGLVLERLAVIAQATGDNDEARRLLEESVALQREIGDGWSLSWALNALSRLALTQLDLAEAERYAVEALTIVMAADNTMNALDTLATLTAVRAQQGLNEVALEMALQILQHPASTQDAKNRVESLRVELAAHLTPQQLEAVQVRVQADNLEAFVTTLLTQVDSS